jgi:hypothetical protein
MHESSHPKNWQLILSRLLHLDFQSMELTQGPTLEDHLGRYRLAVAGEDQHKIRRRLIIHWYLSRQDRQSLYN